MGWLNATLTLPFESGAMQAVAQDLPLETSRLFAHTAVVPLDAWGIWNALFHRWLVQESGVGAIAHVWQVVPQVAVGRLPHRWTVLTETGGQVRHVWRVLPPALVALRSRDIQLPCATIEKTA
jgi:hypothetical protein